MRTISLSTFTLDLFGQEALLDAVQEDLSPVEALRHRPHRRCERSEPRLQLEHHVRALRHVYRELPEAVLGEGDLLILGLPASTSSHASRIPRSSTSRAPAVLSIARILHPDPAIIYQGTAPRGPGSRIGVRPVALATSSSDGDNVHGLTVTQEPSVMGVALTTRSNAKAGPLQALGANIRLARLRRKCRRRSWPSALACASPQCRATITPARSAKASGCNL